MKRIFEILKSVTQAHKEDVKIIFTTLNGLFPIFNSTNEFAKGKENTLT